MRRRPLEGQRFDAGAFYHHPPERLGHAAGDDFRFCHRGILRTTPRLFNRLVGRSYVELIRNVPPLVLIFIFYFFVSDQIIPLLGWKNLSVPAAPAPRKFSGFSFPPRICLRPFFPACSPLPFFRGRTSPKSCGPAFSLLPKGQWEASYALGLSWRQQMTDIILPQALKRVLPPWPTSSSTPSNIQPSCRSFQSRNSPSRPCR
jgi:ABC-type amino acid transport system permease subunit